MNVLDLRSTFLDFFAQNTVGHERVPNFLTYYISSVENFQPPSTQKQNSIDSDKSRKLPIVTNRFRLFANETKNRKTPNEVFFVFQMN